MPALFIILGIAVLTLLALLLWFVPHLLQQQAHRAAGESAQLREILLDVLNEQEAVTLRQAQLGTSLGYLQDQIEQLVQRPALAGPTTGLLPDESLRQIDTRLSDLQRQMADWGKQISSATRHQPGVDEESWSNLMSLLVAIQTRVGELSLDQERRNASAAATPPTRQLLEELEQELEHLHSIADDIARLQNRLRQSLHGRDASFPLIRSAARSIHAKGA